ncbi:MAG TPA: hypothetical protein VHN20_02920 [Beijerinckiaceae bacterium]|nr:hypothetical protein [Beijerinckiaceae bacterium]
METQNTKVVETQTEAKPLDDGTAAGIWGDPPVGLKATLADGPGPHRTKGWDSLPYIEFASDTTCDGSVRPGTLVDGPGPHLTKGGDSLPYIEFASEATCDGSVRPGTLVDGPGPHLAAGWDSLPYIECDGSVRPVATDPVYVPESLFIM